MTQINKLEFRTVIIDDTSNKELNILSYGKENFAIYFSLQSVAQCINEFLLLHNTAEIFHTEFNEKWQELNLRCMTEFQLQLLIPINLVLEPSTELYNPMPIALAQTRYLNDRYKETIDNFANYTNITNDLFAIAEQQNFTNISQTYHHKFINSIAFLSLIPILRLRFIRRLYRTFFLVDLVNGNDIEYIYDTLIANRKRINYLDIGNVFTLESDAINFEPTDLTTNDKEIYVTRFNKACRIFKSFAFNIMDEQSQYIARNLQIVTQFGLDRRRIIELFNNIPKVTMTPLHGQQQQQQRINGQQSSSPLPPPPPPPLHTSNLSDEQVELLCRPPSLEPLTNINTTEVSILHAIIKIHLMIQRMTNTYIQKSDLEFYRKILRIHFSQNINDLLCDLENETEENDKTTDDNDVTRSYEIINDKRSLTKNYTMGEIVWEFMQLYIVAQQNIHTIWLCRFIKMSCNPRYSNLVNIMADFVPYFQRFFTNDFNINTINNIILFLQGMCRPDDDRLKSLKDGRELRYMNVQHFKSFGLTRYRCVNSNPLATFMDLILSNTTRQTKNNGILNLNTLPEDVRENLLNLRNPNEQQFIDYIYELVVGDQKNPSDNDTGRTIVSDPNDLSGDKRFQLQDINYDNIIPIVSTNTFNENNTTCLARDLFTSTINQTMFFHELTNRIRYKIPGVIANIIVK